MKYEVGGEADSTNNNVFIIVNSVYPEPKSLDENACWVQNLQLVGAARCHLFCGKIHRCGSRSLLFHRFHLHRRVQISANLSQLSHLCQRDEGREFCPDT